MNHNDRKILCAYLVLSIYFAIFPSIGGCSDETGILYDQVRRDAASVVYKEQESKRNWIKNITIKQATLLLPNLKPGNLWIAYPHSSPKGIIFFISGTTVHNFKDTAIRYANDGFIFYGLSWLDLDPSSEHLKLFSETYETNLLLKASALASFVIDRLIENKYPLTVVGVSNGGIIASIISNITPKSLNIIYVVSSINFSKSENQQGKYNDNYLHQSIDTNKHTINGILSTHDIYFPFLEAYEAIYPSARGRILILPNQTHAFSMPNFDDVIQTFSSLDKDIEISQPIFTNIDAITNKNNILSISWEGVENIRYFYAYGNPQFAFYYPYRIPWNMDDMPVNIIISGIHVATKLPVSYFIQVR